MAQRNEQIADWVEADAVLGHIRTSDARVAKLLAEREAEKAKVDKRYREPLDDEGDLRKAAAAALAAFCRKHRRDLGDAKSCVLDNGVVGWNLGNPTLSLLRQRGDWKHPLAAICRAGRRLKHWIRVKVEIAKAVALADYAAGRVTDEDLAALGLRVTQVERFYIEPKLDDARDRNA